MDLFLIGVVILAALAVSDLIVGVSNDAANFLNSAIGSKVAPRHVIMVIASLGMLAGVTFSSGMMEVARKGIFHPQYFTMPELMTIFLAVMLTDVILLDLFNTYGLPTSTTVSIVFELLGAAVSVSLLKLAQAGQSYGDVVNYINTGKALAIIAGILLSVAAAFCCGAFVQLVSRILFTFDFEQRLKRFGALWGGVALSSIVYFILIKGAKGASFIDEATVSWINDNTGLILLYTFLGCAILLQLLLSLTRVNILKLIVLAGTFALAMAFAANDLVNFIGVPLAGLAAYSVAQASTSPLQQTMEVLAAPVQSSTLILLVAGAVMVATLWISRKARTVSKTEIRLGRQDEGYERFETSLLSRAVVRLVAYTLEGLGSAFPEGARRWVAGRFDRSVHRPVPEADGTVPSFDLIRAAVNLMVASALISLATSLKLPLSTTYVTFMVAMGTSLSDQAWGRDSAVFRVTGVLTVVGGWFFTALMAFTVSFVFAYAVFHGQAVAVIGLAGIAVALIFRTHHVHKSREDEEEAAEIFNLRKVQDADAAMSTSFEHAGILLRKVREVLDVSFDGVFADDRSALKRARAGQKQIQQWANILAANVFKVMRLRQRRAVERTQRFAQTISTLQELSESVRDMVMRSYLHVDNNHSGLLREQVDELVRVRKGLQVVLDRTSDALAKRGDDDKGHIEAAARELHVLVDELDRNQIVRIQDNVSKTRLSILFYSLLRDAVNVADNATRLLTVFEEFQNRHGDGLRATEPEGPLPSA